MTGMARSSAGLTDRQRRLLYRAWHRGMRETDLIFGEFADSEISALPETELDQFEQLLDQADGDLLSWITGAAPVPAEFDTGLFAKIRSYRPRSAR